MIASLIKLVLSNPSVTLFILGLIASAIAVHFSKRPRNAAAIVEALVAYFFLFTVGIGYLNNFMMHVVFAEYSAQFIGWENSPFQYEVGFASLGIGVAGIIAFRHNLSFRCATFIPLAFFLWGAAGGHIYQILIAHNLEPGNAGAVLYTDIFLPIIGFALLYAQWKTSQLSTTTAHNRPDAVG